METPIQSSFIPHEALQSQIAGVSYEKGGLSDLVFLMSIVLLIASCALAGGVFVYTDYLTKAADSAKESLARGSGDASLMKTIHDMNRLDVRMRSAENIVDTHIAPSIFFDALNGSTLKTISFTSLNFSSTDPQNISIKLTGVARSINSIALQADIFSKNEIITSPIFSGISRENDGVHFNLSAKVDQQKIVYIGSVETDDSGFSGSSVQTQTAKQPANIQPSTQQNQPVPQQQGQSKIIQTDADGEGVGQVQDASSAQEEGQ